MGAKSILSISLIAVLLIGTVSFDAIFADKDNDEEKKKEKTPKTFESECMKKLDKNKLNLDGLFCQTISELQYTIRIADSFFDIFSVSYPNTNEFFNQFLKSDGTYNVDSFFDIFSELQTTDDDLEKRIIELENIINNFDHDGDLVTANDGDCDDANPYVRPSATEIKDGIDNDCDGTIDGPQFEDIDNDGFSPLNGDCDDDNFDVNPGVQEIQDGIDNDCDGTKDEANIPPIATATLRSVPYSTPYTIRDLICYGGAYDEDGGNTTFTIEWTINGNVLPDETSIRLNSDNTSKGDVISCTRTPFDGIDYGESVTSDSITIINLWPSISEISITPENPNADSTLTCHATAIDPDGDPVTISYIWSVNVFTVSGVTTNTLSDEFVSGDSVRCLAKATDGIRAGNYAQTTVIID